MGRIDLADDFRLFCESNVDCELKLLVELFILLEKFDKRVRLP